MRRNMQDTNVREVSRTEISFSHVAAHVQRRLGCADAWFGRRAFHRSGLAVLAGNRSASRHRSGASEPAG